MNAVLGTVTAWVLVRDDFRGKTLVNAVIDLPFALPDDRRRPDAARAVRPDVAGRHRRRVHAHGDRPRAACSSRCRSSSGRCSPSCRSSTASWSRRRTSLGASDATTFRRIVFPNILPGILSGVALAFAKAVGEFGSLVIITGNIPFQTEVSSVYIFGRIESGDSTSAAAVAVVLLAISFVTLLSIGVIRHFATRHDRA